MRTQVQKQDFRQEIYKRVISGVILGGIALFFLIEGGILFVFFVSIFSLLASFEIYKLLEMKGEKPFTQIGIAVSTSIPFITFLAPSEVLFALLTFSLIAIFFIQIISREVRGAIDKIMMTYFGIIYTGWLGGSSCCAFEKYRK
jgi:phosphatidate cytidylyltransferase